MTSSLEEIRRAKSLLEEVRDEIKREIARTRAVERLRAGLTDIKLTLKSYFEARQLWEPGTGPEPTKPDYQALASEHGMTFGETAMLTASELPEQTDFGKSTVDFQQPVAGYAYSSSLLPFRIAESLDADISESKDVADQYPEVVQRMHEFAMQYDNDLQAHKRPLWRAAQ